MTDDRSLIAPSNVPVQAEHTELVDLRQGMMSLPPERMQAALSQYVERRDTFRDWLLSQLKQGIHYGYVPGTEPKFDGEGNLISSRWDKKSNGYVTTKIHPKSWHSKPGLYKAGAEFIVDLMGIRAEYSPDQVGWQQLGAIAGNFVIKCKLFSRASNEVIGEGIGARKVGQKGGDENNAIKMASKSAMVAAVINAYGLSDLFTQDTEDDKPPPHENPEESKSAPKERPRAERQGVNLVAQRQERIKRLKGKWFADLNQDGAWDPKKDFEELRRRFANWCRINSEHETLDPEQPQTWGPAEDEAFAKCEARFSQ